MGSEVLERSDVNYYFQFDPGRRFSRIGVQRRPGRLDRLHQRPGRPGGQLRALRHDQAHRPPGARLQRRPPVARRQRRRRTARASLHRPDRAPEGDLQLHRPRLPAGDRRVPRRRPRSGALHLPGARQSGSFAGSALFAYQINWQTVLFVGYADDRLQDPLGDLQPADRVVFVKVSYAFQR